MGGVSNKAEFYLYSSHIQVNIYGIPLHFSTLNAGKTGIVQALVLSSLLVLSRFSTYIKLLFTHTVTL